MVVRLNHMCLLHESIIGGTSQSICLRRRVLNVQSAPLSSIVSVDLHLITSLRLFGLTCLSNLRCVLIRRGVGSHFNICGTPGEIKSRLLFSVWNHFQNCFVSTMEGSKIGVVRLLGDEVFTGGSVLVFPVNPDSLGNWKIIRGHSFRIRVQFDVQTV